MLRTLTISITATLLSTVPAMAQQASGRPSHSPLYRVTVIQRQVDAVNYQYRSGPTRIGFKGTVLMTGARGEATVESQRGRTEITAKFDHVAPPGRYGREYLTYVLWAISPEGAPHNLGEVVTNGSERAALHVTTDLQAFGLIVTAEPYSAVRVPGDVVVMENVVRPDTVGRIQPIRANYELLPRGEYTWQVREHAGPSPNAPKVSMREYEAISQVYQAQNAVERARAANVAQLAPGTFAEAERKLAEAKRLQSTKADTSLIVQSARAAAQTAEDARIIAERRGQEQELAEARNAAASAEQARVHALAEAQRARAEAEAAHARADAERTAREQAESEAAVRAREATQAQAQADRLMSAPSRPDAAPQKTRKRLIEELSQVMSVRDTPKGLVITVPDDAFRGANMNAGYAAQLGRVAAILVQEPNLRLEVEGHTDNAPTAALAERRALTVQRALVTGGLGTLSIPAHGLGASRLLTSNATAAGRIENRRVEIIISGAAVGDAPVWGSAHRLSDR